MFNRFFRINQTLKLELIDEFYCAINLNFRLNQFDFWPLDEFVFCSLSIYIYWSIYYLKCLGGNSFLNCVKLKSNNYLSLQTYPACSWPLRVCWGWPWTCSLPGPPPFRFCSRSGSAPGGQSTAQGRGATRAIGSAQGSAGAGNGRSAKRHLEGFGAASWRPGPARRPRQPSGRPFRW